MRSYLQNIIDSMPSVLVGVDPAGKITLWNSEAERATAVVCAKALGQPLREVYPALAEQMVKAQPFIATDRPLKSKRFTRKVDGKIHYMDVMAYPLGNEGCEGMVLRVDDVTVRVQIEGIMLQTEKMLSVGGLAAGMAHELNNPLGGMLQLLQNVMRRLSTELPQNFEVAKECGIDLHKLQLYLEKRGIINFFEGIRSSGMKASAIVANMVQFCSKSESRFVTVNLAELINRSVELAATDYDLKKKHGFRNIKIIREYDPELSEISCIPAEVEQVILHLLKNAAQSMAAQKSVVDPRIYLRTRREDGMVRIEVEDNGLGMTEEVSRHIFEPFFTTKGPGAGTGLGLSVSYFIVTEIHKGTLRVESTPGKGAKFIVRLPGLLLTQDSSRNHGDSPVMREGDIR